VVILGGYGVFGTHVARSLAGYGIPVIVAGRDRGRAKYLAAELGPAHGFTHVDLTDSRTIAPAIRDASVVIHCAGPYRSGDRTVLQACLDQGCHYVDINDNRAYLATVLADHDKFASRGLFAAAGCSSLPAISGALAIHARAGLSASPQCVRVTLFIGNNNPKGAAAVTSMMMGLGRTIHVPQGTLHGGRHPELVSLPHFGNRTVVAFESPEYDLFPSLLGTREVRVKVGFEMALATRMMTLLARAGPRWGRRTANILIRCSSLFRRVGCSGGVVQTELFDAGGMSRRSALFGASDGQRMAALPAALVARALCESPPPRPGAGTAYELLGAEGLLGLLVKEGFELFDASDEAKISRS
jgi:hypothetical protein